jgi:hypothetical protein
LKITDIDYPFTSAETPKNIVLRLYRRMTRATHIVSGGGSSLQEQ